MANAGVPAVRVAMEPFEGSRTAENSHALCTGKKGVENNGMPDGLIAMEPSQASRTAEYFPVLCTDQKDAEKSGSVLHHATPAALPDHTPLLLLQAGKVDAIQRHNTGLYLGRLPSSSTTNMKDVAVLSHSRIDSAPEVFGEMPTSGTGYVYCPGHHNISLNTCVLDRNGNLSEQNIDDMPQASGFHNLNCKSVVLEPMFAVYKDETDSSSSELESTFAVSNTVLFPGSVSFGSSSQAPVFGTTTASSTATTGPTTRPSAEAQVRVEAAISKDMPRAVLDLKRRLDEQQARDQTSFDTLQGELARLSSMAAQLAVSIGKFSTSAISGSSAVGATGTASVAPKVFVDMPTPNSWNGTHVKAPECENYGYGHPDEIQSSCVQGGRTNLTEQYGLPHPYGFGNLNRQTVFLADGTEHSYYTLPADYPLKLATPQLSSSTAEIVCVRAPPSVATHAGNEQNTDNEHVVVCVNKAPASAFREDATTIHAPLFSVGESDECSISNNKIELPALTDSEIGCAQEKAQVHNHQWDMLLTEREVWDPGASTSLLSSKAKPPREASYVAIMFPKSLNLCNQFGTHVQQLRDPPLYVLVLHERRKEWDPGVPVISHSCTTNHPRDFTHMLLVLSASYSGVTEDCLASQKLMANTSCKVATLIWHSSIFGTPVLLLNNTNYTWDPGVAKLNDTVLDICAVPHQVQFVQQSTVLSFLRLKFSVSSVQWDPGIGKPSSIYLWLHIHKTQLVDCTSTATHACYSAPACSPPTPISTQASSDTEFDEFTSPCVGFHLQQSTKWTSTSLNGIASSEYAYTMDFIIDQWEFLHNQGVKKSYNAKNLLSSPNYLQILTLDILFITFLPP